MKRLFTILVILVLVCSCSGKQGPESTEAVTKEKSPRVAMTVTAAARGTSPAGNSIMTLSPYRHRGTWVFDDPTTGLVREPFVAGIPEMIDHMVKDIPNAKNGFRMLFSAQPFPGYMIKVTWRRKDSGGNWYYSEELDMEGWLCPALFKYFRGAPKEIYVKAERLTP